MSALTTLDRRDLGEKRDYRGKPTRRLTTEWVVKSGTDDRGNTYEVLAQVTTSHYGKTDLYGYPEKMLLSRFGWIARHRGDTGCVVEKWSSDNKDITVRREDLDRYSKKRLTTAHDAAVDLTLTVVDDTNLAEVLAQAADYEGSYV